LIENIFHAYNGDSCLLRYQTLGKEGIVLPFIRFKGFETQFLQVISPEIVESFAHLAEVAQEKVKLESLQVEAITNSPLSVEIFMFPRDQEKHDAIAHMIHRILAERGFPQVHIFFVLLSPSLYYKEGLPLKSVNSTITR
jgi:Domain of unknown function (DUF1904)